MFAGLHLESDNLDGLLSVQGKLLHQIAGIFYVGAIPPWLPRQIGVGTGALLGQYIRKIGRSLLTELLD